MTIRYHVRILNEATAELARLSPPIGRQVVKKINWLAEHLNNLYPEALTGHLLGLYKLRVGDYRVLYQILEDEQTIVIHQVGYRREIYKRRR